MKPLTQHTIYRRRVSRPPPRLPAAAASPGHRRVSPAAELRHATVCPPTPYTHALHIKERLNGL